MMSRRSDQKVIMVMSSGGQVENGSRKSLLQVTMNVIDWGIWTVKDSE